MSQVFYREPAASYPVAVRGAGVYLYDADGRDYLDMSGGAAVSAVGHGHPQLIAAIQDQVERLAFAHTSFFTNEAQEELAERLAARFGEPDAKAWFTSGGSEANESALKIAWQYWRARGKPDKSIVISRQWSYHGGTLGAVSVSGSLFRRAPYEKVLHDWPRIAPCYAYRHRRDDESEAEYGQRAANELESALEIAGAENVAAFIAEPVVGATLGAVAAVPGYFRTIREICDRHEVLFIADEVMCGSGRTGTFFAHEADGVLPDLVTLAKGIGGGYQPLGAVVCRDAIREAIASDPGGFAHGHTYVGHPVACAAGVAVQRIFDDGLLASVPARGRRLLELLCDNFGSHPHVGDIRGRGLFAGIEFVQDRESKAAFPADAKIAAKLKKALMANGLILYPGGGSVDGRAGAHVLIAPPFVAEQEDFEELCARLAKALDGVFGNGG